MPFDRTKYFDAVRGPAFGGKMTDQQVKGQEAILDAWEREREPLGEDIRFLGYELATAKHETASTMWPIEEYGKGSGQPYGKQDPETKQCYYGRGFVQCTWRDNYRKATQQLGLKDADDLEWHAERALDLDIAAQIMFRGMTEGWFRSDSKGPQKLDRYFNTTADDPYGAREVINGDKHLVPDWSHGQSIGNLIGDYHDEFLHALEIAHIEAPELIPPEPQQQTVAITIDVPHGIRVTVNGKPVT